MITPRKGPIEGTSRILRELLRTPRFKASVRIILRDLDPENGALLMRTLMFEDPEFFLSLVSAVPALTNTVIAAVRETMSQAAAFPPGVLTGFMAGMLEEVDSRGLGQAVGQALALSGRLSAIQDPELARSAAAFWEGVGAGITESLPQADEAGEGAVGLLLDALMPLLGSAVAKLGAQAVKEGSEARLLVRSIAQSMRTIASENPEFMQEVILPLVAAARDALAQAEDEAVVEGEGEA